LSVWRVRKDEKINITTAIPDYAVSQRTQRARGRMGLKTMGKLHWTGERNARPTPTEEERRKNATFKNECGLQPRDRI